MYAIRSYYVSLNIEKNGAPDMLLPDVRTPTLLLDAAICRRNITRMQEKAASHGLVFRPHFKTVITSYSIHYTKLYDDKQVHYFYNLCYYE